MKKTTLKTLSVILAAIMLLMPFAVFAEKGVTYDMGAELQVGEAEYAASALEYTVYTLKPSEVGEYTISGSNPVGIVSYNGMWVSVEPTAATITANSVTWKCTAVGQTIWVAVRTNGAPAVISVERADVQIITTKSVPYENTVVPEPFSFEEHEDITTLTAVNVTDENVDYPVLGEDGFYHLNSENGPRLFADLTDEAMALYALREPGQLSSLVYKEDGTVDYKLDYNAAFDEYWACATSEGYYPLTDDLITMFTCVGEARDWYGEDGWLSLTSDDAWMFACYYFPSELPPYDMGSALEVGEKEYEACSRKYTIYTFDPTETGNYVFTSDALMGIVSYTGMWLTVEPDETNVTENILSWKCESIGQAIWIAVEANGAPVTVNVEQKELDIFTIETIVYENVTTPEAFVFDGEQSDLTQVDTDNAIVDKAVLGEDGYYHLNSAAGPILYVDLNYAEMSLPAIIELGQLKIAEMNENGETAYYVDYNEAAQQYVDCADSATGLYPLTEDLITLYQTVGAAKGWYGENGYLGGIYDDAWMFACYYDASQSFDPTAYTVTIDGAVFGQFKAGETVELPAQAPTTISGFFARFFNYTGAEVTRSAYNKANTVNGRTYTMVMPEGDVDLTSEYVILGNLYDNDAKVNSRDTALLKKYVNNPENKLTEQQAEAADIELDGKVNSRDTLSMKKLANGTYTPKK